jgi:hypothetical protein
VVDGDVGLAAGAVGGAARAGHLGSMRASTCCMRAKLARAWRVLLVELAQPPAPSRTSATAPFSATMASTGQASANGSLQPTGRPVTGTTCRPARAGDRAPAARRA